MDRNLKLAIAALGVSHWRSRHSLRMVTLIAAKGFRHGRGMPLS
jgi:hypothetical protein